MHLPTCRESALPPEWSLQCLPTSVIFVGGTQTGGGRVIILVLHCLLRFFSVWYRVGCTVLAVRLDVASSVSRVAAHTLPIKAGAVLDKSNPPALYYEAHQTSAVHLPGEFIPDVGRPSIPKMSSE